jgi:hypothetical protein
LFIFIKIDQKSLNFLKIKHSFYSFPLFSLFLFHNNNISVELKTTKKEKKTSQSLVYIHKDWSKVPQFSENEGDCSFTNIINVFGGNLMIVILVKSIDKTYIIITTHNKEQPQ